MAQPCSSTVNPLHFLTAVAADDRLRAGPDFRRFALALAAFTVLPPLLIAAFIIAVDPYFAFGSPSVPGLNAVRPYYESNIFSAKPYQVRRIRPAAISLGSSRVEVGLNTRHRGWADPRTFNFGLPGSTSYEVMLAFLHAQSVARPLKQAVVGLDFFGFNIFFPRAREQQQARFARDGARAFAGFLATELATRPPGERVATRADPDVQHDSAHGALPNGPDPVTGGGGHRADGAAPSDWDEAGYLQVNPDAASRIAQGAFASGYQHYLAVGRFKGLLGGFQPADWNEAGYLATNPEAGIEIALGAFRTGYLHYAAVGQARGLAGGLPPADPTEWLRLRWPLLDRALFQVNDMLPLVLSREALKASLGTVLRQSMPAPFDDSGVRLFGGQEETLRRLGGVGHLIRSGLGSGAWGPWLKLPRLMYCFTNADTGMTMFDPFRFMLRQAYAEGTDLRMFVTPVHAVVRTLQQALGLGERYEFWLKELVRINEEEAARAGRPPLPLWDFSDANTITREPVPPSTEMTPMRWFWEHSHYRKITGDLVLDRVFGTSAPERPLPADFGVRLTAANIDAHIARAGTGLRAWAAANSDLVSPIVRAAQTSTTHSRQAEATCW